MSGLFSKKFTEQQEFQEGEVPDDLSDQPVTNYNRLIAPITQPIHLPIAQNKKTQLDEDQFIFETVPDSQLQAPDYGQRNKPYKNQDFYQQNRSKDWERTEKQKIPDRIQVQKIQQKKDNLNFQPKRKSQFQEQFIQRTTLPSQIPSVPLAYYSNIPPNLPPSLPPNLPPNMTPIASSYNPSFYPGYGPQPGVRHPYMLYPQMHHQPSPGMYVPPAQGAYPIPNPHIYPVSQPPIPYGSVPIVQTSMPELYRMEHPQIIQKREPGKAFNYDKQQTIAPIARGYQQLQPYNQLKATQQQRIQQGRQRQDLRAHENRQKSQDGRFSEERQRSRDRKQYFDTQRKYSQIPFDPRGSLQTSSKERKDSQYGASKNEKNVTVKQQKKKIQEEMKSKLKGDINEEIKIIFGTNVQEKEEFLFVLRDLLKYRLMKREEQQIGKLNGFQVTKPVSFYSLSKELIESNNEKGLLKLENLIVRLTQAQKLQNSQAQSTISKKQSLFKILTSLQLQDLVLKIKEMRLKKKLIGDKKMSEIKKLLEQLVKDPRKRIK